MARRPLIILFVLVSLLLIVSSLSAQTVISRTRVGNFQEGSAYVSTGHLAGNIAVLDGQDVFVFPLNKPKKGLGFTKAFDVRGLPLVGRPNGIGYIPQEQTFVFTEGSNLSPDKLFLSDATGKSRGTITVKYLGGWTPNHVEGIAYIPPDSPIYPDHFVTATVATLTYPYDERLEVIARDGTVVQEIRPAYPLGPPGLWEDTLGGVEFLPGGTLLCGFSNYLVEYTFDGTIIRVVPYDQGWFEGVTRLPNGGVVLVGYQQGMLAFLDANLNRTPSLDRNYLFLPGLNDLQGLVWNSDVQEYFLRLNYTPVHGFYDPAVWTMPSTLGVAGELFGFPETGFPDPLQYRQMTYMPDEHLLAILYRQNFSEGIPGPCTGLPGCIPPHADIHLYDSRGNLVQMIHMPDVTYNSRGFVPGQLGYVPSLRQFVVRKNNPDGTTTPFALFISRDTGAVVRAVDLTSAGLPTGFGSVVYFNENGTEKLLFTYSTPAHATHLVVTGLGGVKLQDIDTRASLGVLFPGVFSTAPTAGTFVTMEGGEFVVFNLTPATKKKK